MDSGGKGRKELEMAIYLYVYTKEKRRRKTMGLTSENYVDEAEKVIKTLIEKDRNGRNVIRLTTSKIRGFFH